MASQSPTADRTSARAQVRRILRAQVASGELQPGEIYSAVVLANRLAVSAPPVREAMLDLASAGLVEAVRNRGFRILTVSPQDLDEIVTLRIWLEVPAMQQVIERASDEEIDALSPLAQNIIDAAQRRDVSDFLLADHTFHTSLLQLARNDRLIRLVDELRGQTQLLGLHRLGRAGQLDTSAHEHVELLDAVRARDATTAQTIMRRHLARARGIGAGLDETGDAPGTEDAA